MTVLFKREYIKCGFEIVVSLISYDHDWSQWNDKWERDSDGLVVSDSERFDCKWYSIGNDVTVAQAQEEFESDRYRFDTSLTVTILKNGIELVDEHVIGSDFSCEDDYTEEQSFNDLCSDYLDDEEYITEAKNVLKELLS